MTNISEILVGNPEVRSSRREPVRRCEDNIMGPAFADATGLV
jgi:hypothetical protein